MTRARIIALLLDLVGSNDNADINTIISALEEEFKRTDDVISFYAKAWNFKTAKPPAVGLEWFPSEELLNDCGNRAQEAVRPDPIAASLETLHPIMAAAIAPHLKPPA